MQTLAINYFSKLLNLSLDKNTLITLSSGQSARAHAWLMANHFDISKVDLRGGFTISSFSEEEEGKGEQTQPTKNIPPVNANELSTSVSNSIGIDIQSISELFPQGLSNDPKSESELLAIYTLNELSYAQSKPDPLQTLTGIFAAKEAILKCSQKTMSLNDLEVLPDVLGKPSTAGFSLSISHSLDYAIAIAICNLKDTEQEKININSTALPFSVMEESKIYKGNIIIDFIFVAITLVLIFVETYLLFK